MEIPELMEFYLNLPALDVMPANPTTVTTIINHQMRDRDLRIITLNNNQYSHHEIQVQDVVIYYPDEQDRLNWKIAIPRTLIKGLILWYHINLGYAREQILYDTVHQRYHHQKLRDLCKQTVQGCPHHCQQHKKLGKGYGYHAPRLARLAPWTEVAVDLIGPWKYYNKETDTEYTFNALTCIDTVTKFVEIICVRYKNSIHIAQQFANCWLLRFPKPNYCIH